MIVTMFVSLLVTCVTAGEDVKDGMLYQITSTLDNNVLTITSPDMDVGSNVTLQPWLDQSNQKFLAVTMKQGESERFLLVPRRQKFDWAKFVAQGSGSLKDRRGDLTETTLVLAVEVKGKEKFVTQQFKNEKTSQQWQFTKVSGTSGNYLIKNVDNELCLKNPGVEKKKGGLFSKIKNSAMGILHHGKKTPHFVEVHMEGCNKDEPGQQWILESHS